MDSPSTRFFENMLAKVRTFIPKAIGSSRFELLPGPWPNSNPYPPRKLPPLGHVLCSAVVSIHEQGFLHRDIKPGNIMIAPGLGNDISLRLSTSLPGVRERTPGDPDKTLGTGPRKGDRESRR